MKYGGLPILMVDGGDALIEDVRKERCRRHVDGPKPSAGRVAKRSLRLPRELILTTTAVELSSMAHRAKACVKGLAFYGMSIWQTCACCCYPP